MSSPQEPARDLDLGALFGRAWKLFSDKPAEHVVAGLIVMFLGGLTLGLRRSF